MIRGAGRPAFESNRRNKLLKYPVADLLTLATKSHIHFSPPERWTKEAKELLVDSIIEEEKKYRKVVDDPKPVRKRLQRPTPIWVSILGGFVQESLRLVGEVQVGSNSRS